MVNRIRELLDIRQLSPTQFADLIGVGRPVISHILSERNKPSLEVVQKVISAFPDVSLSWLMSGTGPMLTGATPAATAPVVPSIVTLPSVSAPYTVPPAQVQNVAPSEAATLATPPLAVPHPLAVSAPVPAPLPVAAAIPPVVQPTRLPQPPKFRPAAKAGPYSEPSVLATAPVPSLPAGPVDAPLVAAPPIVPLPTPVPEPVVSPNASILPTTPVMSMPVPPAVAEVPPVAPAYSASVESAAVAVVPIPAPAPVPASPVEVLPPVAPNPAAAFSFLGEAGKTIRRIVLFYSDGSFSDYKPEGQ